MDGVSDRVPTPTHLEAAVRDFLDREHPSVTLGDMIPTEYAIVPVRALNSLGHALDPESSKPRAHVSIDPGIKSGAPCIAGTRLTAEWMADHIWGGWTLDDILKDWDYLTKADLLVACWYVGTYGSRTWRKRWGAWAEEAHRFLHAKDRQAECPWPPTSQAAAPSAGAAEAGGGGS
jgi:uncharacterized protein (DUF433 family)